MAFGRCEQGKARNLTLDPKPTLHSLVWHVVLQTRLTYLEEAVKQVSKPTPMAKSATGKTLTEILRDDPRMKAPSLLADWVCEALKHYGYRVKVILTPPFEP